MTEAQEKNIRSKAYSVESAKRRVVNAKQAQEAAHQERRAADAELSLRAQEYQSACDEAIGRMAPDFSRGSEPRFAR